VSGREKDIKFIGIDGLPNEGVQKVNKGELTATFTYVTPGAEGLRQAIKFLKFLTSEPSQVKWAESGQMSPVQGVSDKAKLDEQTEAMLALMSSASAIVPPPDNKYPVPVAEAFYQAAAFAASGEKNAKDALVWLDETLAAMGKQ